MRLKLAALSLLACASSLPALAQSYSQVCGDVRGGRQAAGAVLGAIAGGLAGNGLAANKNRDEGAILGAVVGAVAGSQIGRSSQNCAPTVYGPADAYPAANYGRSDPYYAGRSPNEYNPYPYGSGDGYWRGGESHQREYSSYDRYPQQRRHKQLADSQYYEYDRSGDFAGRECADARQITRLPDGTEIHRPVEACRVARYGDWRVED